MFFGDGCSGQEASDNEDSKNSHQEVENTLEEIEETQSDCATEISDGYAVVEQEEVMLPEGFIKLTKKEEAELQNIDGLSCEAQHDLFGYAKKRIFGMNQDMKLRDKFWSVIEKGGIEDGTWEDVEEFADQLVLKENTGKKIGYCSKLTL